MLFVTRTSNKEKFLIPLEMSHPSESHGIKITFQFFSSWPHGFIYIPSEERRFITDRIQDIKFVKLEGDDHLSRAENHKQLP